jgi:hypothetical protein
MKRVGLLFAAAATLGVGFGVAGVLQAATPPTVVATVGPSYTISLKRPTGALVSTLRPGAYKVMVRDLSTIHNAHLVGPGVNKKTLVATKGTATWALTLKAGQYRLYCDRHPTMLRILRVSAGTTAPPPTTTAPPPPTTTDDGGYGGGYPP